MSEKNIVRETLKDYYLTELLKDYGYKMKEDKSIHAKEPKPNLSVDTLNKLFNQLAEEKADKWFVEHYK